MKTKKISFLLSKISEGGAKEEPQVVPVDNILWEDQKLNRRGFLGTGLVASAALLFLDSCSIGQNLSKNCQKGLAHKDSINALTFSNDGKTLTSGAYDYIIKFWKMPEGALTKTITDLSLVKCIGKSPEGNVIVNTNIDSTKSCWNLSNNGNKSKILDSDKNGSFTKIVYSPNGRIIACGTELGKIELRDASTKNVNLVLSAHKEEISFLKISPDGKFMVSTGNKDLIIWDFNEYKLICYIRAHKNNISGLYICPDGKSFITSDNDGKIKQWSLPHGTLIKSTENKNAESVDCMEGNSAGTLLATSSENMEITLWNLPDLSPLRKLTGHTNRVYSLAISPDGTLLASGSRDGRIRLWKLPEGTSLSCLMDLECSPSSIKGNRYTTINERGETITYTMPCGSPLPPGAKCICNCVPGSIKPPAPVRRSWSSCSCNQVCTCVPVYR